MKSAIRLLIISCCFTTLLNGCTLEDETEDLVIPGIEDIEESEEIEEVEVKLVEEVPTKEAKKEPEIIIEEPVESVKEKEIVSQRKKDFVLPDLSSVLSKDKKAPSLSL